jgi:ATP-binding cassette subfamily C protein
MRDAVTCGAEDRVGWRRVRTSTTRPGRPVAGPAHRGTDRSAGHQRLGPLLLILLAAPWLVRNGVTAGAIPGAVTSVSQALQPALQGFVQGLGNSGLWLPVTVGRMPEAAAESGPEPARGATASGPGGSETGGQPGPAPAAWRCGASPSPTPGPRNP